MKQRTLKALTTTLLLSILAAVCTGQSASGGLAPTTVHLRTRVAVPDMPGGFRFACQTEQWNPSETAIIICDMWDRHWCQGASRRVAELAPQIDRVATIARDKGILIIHAPSDTIGHYGDYPGRKIAKDAPRAANLPEGIDRWCHWKDDIEREAGYPIDHSDGGCDCRPRCPESQPWTRQIDIIEIKDNDAISDSGVEIWNLLEQRKIKNVILMGVHTNMCVLGRPFGLRNLSRFGKNVVLMRDLTDAMYNSAMPPGVSHFTGVDLVVGHVEQFVCPTIASTDLTGQPPFRFKEDQRPLVVFLSAESEYSAAETLPDFARELEFEHGLACQVLQGSTEKAGPDRHEISGMEILAHADLVVVYARRRAFPTDQMKHLHAYLDRGGPLIGLRTASHAFDSRGSGPAGHADWPTFDPDVLGGNYQGHYGAGPVCTVTRAAGAGNHPILAGIRLPLTSNGSLYRTSPLAAGTTLLLVGAIPGQEPEPVAWTNRYKKSRIFYTSLGHPDDFQNAPFRRLLVNAVRWALDTP